MMKYGCPSAVWPKSKISTMFSWPIDVDRARLVEEAGDDLGIARQRGVQDLDRDLRPITGCSARYTDAHPALAELPGDPVVADSS